jgi:hypothetical protein
MDAAGETGSAIAAWVEAVVAAYGRRIDELTEQTDRGSQATAREGG